MTEAELRQLWEDEYCKPASPIFTFDKIVVKFYPDMFDHAFYESHNRMRRDKSVLSLNRLEKMLWVKATLQDPEAILKQGWDRDLKIYDNGRRVAFIRNNYVVVIRFTGIQKATFVTAYELTDNTGNGQKILDSPDWIPDRKWTGEA
jgi:hypothetical protein